VAGATSRYGSSSTEMKMMRLPAAQVPASAKIMRLRFSNTGKRKHMCKRAVANKRKIVSEKYLYKEKQKKKLRTVSSDTVINAGAAIRAKLEFPGGGKISE
jgi:hypothetical protein